MGSGSPRRDEPYVRLPPRPACDDHAVEEIPPKSDEPLFGRVRVWPSRRVRILERTDRVVEVDPMFASVGLRFAGIPLEGHRIMYAQLCTVTRAELVARNGLDDVPHLRLQLLEPILHYVNLLGGSIRGFLDKALSS